MADITDPTFVGFTNETLRVLADYLVGIKDALDTASLQWTDTMSAIIAGEADDDVVIDGSALDGRTPLTKADILTIVAAYGAILGALTPTVMTAMVKAHVKARNPVAG